MKYSVNQIKNFCGSKSKWAGKYILNIEDNFQPNDALLLWRIFETYLITGNDTIEELIWDSEVVDIASLLEDFENLKYNASELEVEKGGHQIKVEWELLGQLFQWYVDIMTEDTVIDIKTARYLTKKDWDSKNMRSNLSNMEEYELQCWVYMKLSKRKKAKIIEVAKHKYKDDRKSAQIIEFELTEEMDKRMTEQYQPIVNEMSELWNKYKSFIIN